MNDAAPADEASAQDSRLRTFPLLSKWLRPLLTMPTPVIFLGAALLAGYVLWRQGAVAGVGQSLQEVPPWTWVSVLLAYTGSILILATRWHVLARMAGGAPAWSSSSQVFLTSVIVNYAAPIGLAVPTRAALTVRDLGLTPRQSATVVGWEVGLDVVALTLISAVWLLMGGGALVRSITIRESQVAAILAVAMVVAAGLLALLLQSVRSRLARLLRPMLSDPRRQPALATSAVALTALFWGTQSGIMAALLAAFGTPPSAPLVLGVMGLPVLIGMLSPVPGGAGVREALMAAAAQLESIPAGPVVLAAITYRLALFVVTPVAWALVRLARGMFKRR